MIANRDLTLRLTDVDDTQILALAQFVKRVGWSELRLNAVDDEEAYAIVHAILRLRLALAEAGYAPR